MKKLFIELSILLFLAAVFMSDSNPPPSGWYQQLMPNLGGQSISSITFLDSLTGFAVTQSAPISDTAYVLKTTNGGDNWIIKYKAIDDYSRVMFANQDTGFISGGDLIKTTNAGENWTSINRPNQTNIEDMFVLSNDTLWLVDNNSLTGGVYRTTNGGGSWDRQLALGSQNPNHIYMYNGRLGFICEDNVYLRRTTNGGLNWDTISGAGGFVDMYFADSLTGWKTSMQKTTDGGMTWVNQILPTGGNIILSEIKSFSNINKDTIWGVGGYTFTPSNGDRGMIYRTVNGGNNWLFQTPDTSIHINMYFYAQFINKNNGWVYHPLSAGLHTTTGGDTTWYTGIQQISNAVPEKFILKQNYPNPFNPRTVIPYSLSASAHVKIIAYDITGKEVQRMVDNYQHAGAYEVDFMGKFTASGVYLYRMTVDGEVVGTKKMILLK